MTKKNENNAAEKSGTPKQGRNFKISADAISDFFFCIIIGTLFSYALSNSVVTATFLEEPQMNLLLVCACLSLGFYIWFYNSYSFLVFSGILIISAFITLLVLKNGDFQAEWFLELNRTAKDIGLFLGYQIPYRDSMGVAFAAAIAFITTFLMILNIKVSQGFFGPAVLAFAAIAVPVYMKWQIASGTIMITTFCLLALFIKRMSLFSAADKEKNTASPLPGLVILPVSLIIFLVSWYMPKPDINGVTPKLPDSVLENESPASLTPENIVFSDSGSLGGPVKLGNALVMEVLADNSVYLGAAYMDTYTGRSWILSEKDTLLPVPEQDGIYRTSEYSDELYSNQTELVKNGIGRKRNVLVRMGYVRTNHVFTPPFRNSLYINSGYVPIFADSGGAITAENPFPQNTIYTQEFIDWGYSLDKFADILRALPPNDALYYAEMEKHLALPDDLPKRVRDLAEEITEAYTSDYDKIKALEKYLTEYTYTTEPPNVPAGRDLVDYFLFDEKRGYCVYYASSLAVMGRSIGVPTRYVEGFAVSGSKNAEDLFAVRESDAHAWAEVFFSEFGWVIFEATAPRYTDVYAEPARELTPQEEKEYTEMHENQIQGNEQDPEPETPVDDETIPETAKNPFLKSFVSALIVILVLGGFTAVFARVMYILYSKRIAAIDAMDNNRAVAEYFLRFTKAAGILGYAIKPNESAAAYIDRTCRQIPISGGETQVRQLGNIFLRARYSKYEADDNDKNTMKNCYNELAEILRPKNWRIIIYFINRYILMRF